MHVAPLPRSADPYRARNVHISSVEEDGHSSIKVVVIIFRIFRKWIAGHEQFLTLASRFKNMFTVSRAEYMCRCNQ